MEDNTGYSRLNAARQPTDADRQEQLLPVISAASNDQGDEKGAKRVRMSTVWARELFALIFSSASLVTIGILLVVYHGRPIRSFSQAITLNGVVSILATGYKAALLYVVSSALGQSKWNWYARGLRRLDDFERIDEASRGPLGAFRLLYGQTEKMSVVSLAAVVVILALLIDPFSQQLVHFAESPFTVADGSVWTEVFTNIFDIPDIKIETDLDNLRIQQSLHGAVWNNASFYDRKVHCPTGNCVFPPFKTLEWCAKTETFDISRVSTNCSLFKYNADDFAMINRNDNQTGEEKKDSLVCGWFIDNNTTPLIVFQMTLSVGTSNDDGALDSSTTGIKEFPSHFVAMHHEWIGTSSIELVSPDWTCRSFLNITCPPLTVNYVSLDVSLDADQGSLERIEQSALTLCATEYDIIVSSGVQIEKDVRSQHGRFEVNVTEPEQGWVTIGRLCFTSSYDHDIYPPFSDDADFSASQPGNTMISFCRRDEGGASESYETSGEWAWDQWLNVLAGSVFRDQTEYSSIYWNSSGEWIATEWSVDDTFDHNFLEMIRAKGMKVFMEGIAVSMNSAWGQMSQERVTGSYIRSETIFEISWAWIILPVTLNVLSYVILVSVVLNSMKGGQGKPWKGSILASLYHGLREDCVSGDVDTLEAMEKAAEATHVELKFVDQEGRMVLSR
ncbi:hypothetical protein F5X97DRAFT_247838 [Nemania serpens]|nr:hypothetical protein F5X97DRAFT_247838 [Nemania serpens]